jgi:hypothetical protein
VQVVGLSRWPLPVPGLAASAPAGSAATTVAQAHDSFETAHVLGDIIGESMG